MNFKSWEKSNLCVLSSTAYELGIPFPCSFYFEVVRHRAVSIEAQQRAENSVLVFEYKIGDRLLVVWDG